MNPRVTELDIAIAAQIKALREANSDITLGQVAKFIGVSYQSYQRMEAGKVSFRVSTLDRLATFFGLEMSHFVTEVPPVTLPNHGHIQYVVNAMKTMSSGMAESVVQHMVSLCKRKS